MYMAVTKQHTYRSGAGHCLFFSAVPAFQEVSTPRFLLLFLQSSYLSFRRNANIGSGNNLLLSYILYFKKFPINIIRMKLDTGAL